MPPGRSAELATRRSGALARALGLGDPPWIVGHRGAPRVETENTVASLQRAAEVGVDAVELDVQLTADGELAVVHDWSLERLAASAAVVERTPWRDLSRLSVRDPQWRTPSQPIPRLADMLAAAPPELPLNIELKRQEADRDGLIDALLVALSARPRVWVSSFDWELLARLRHRAPALPLAPLASRRRHGFESLATELAAVALHCASRVISWALLQRARTAARPVLVYTVNGPTQARDLVARGVAGLFTDDPARLIAALRAER